VNIIMITNERKTFFIHLPFRKSIFDFLKGRSPIPFDQPFP
jgi:hypothetical protein